MRTKKLSQEERLERQRESKRNWARRNHIHKTNIIEQWNKKKLEAQFIIEYLEYFSDYINLIFLWDF